MRNNASIMSDLQVDNLKKKIENSHNGYDLDYRGYDSKNRKNGEFAKKGTSAHINRVLFWLSSKHNDYIRKSTVGGVLYSLIGSLNTNTNLSMWEREIQDKFNDNFANDLNLILIRLSTDKKYRTLYIRMIIQDRVTNSTFTVSTEVNK